jgi:hypothetical protein
MVHMMKQAFPLVFRLYEKSFGQSWYLLKNDCSSLLEKAVIAMFKRHPKFGDQTGILS